MLGSSFIMIFPKKFSDLKIGEKLIYARTLGEGDCALFVSASGDFNPYHTDEIFARNHRFGKRIVPGLLTASLFTHIGGELGFLATKMTFEYKEAVFIGDTITASAELVRIDEKRRFLKLACVATNQDGKIVLTAEAEGFPTLD
jgi:3-hydroxybutyryl-CoA dehydratase